MPAPKVKPLSRGKCLQDLKKVYDKEFTKKNALSLCTAAGKLLEAAEKERRDGNEEECYIYYMKYLNVISYVQGTEEYKQNKKQFCNLLPSKSVQHALESAEKLNQSLKKRYELLAMEEQKGKEKAESETSSIIKELEEQSNIDVDKRKHQEQTFHMNNEELQDCISSMELYKILQKQSSSVLILDVRPRNQFSDSHINLSYCISIPEEIIEPGYSASRLAEKLPPDSKVMWAKRTEVDYLILMDWFSSSSTLESKSPLHYLRSIILEWDPSSEYRSKPRILDGGYEDWLSHYPMHCTNSTPHVPVQDFEELLHIDDVKYPTLIDETPKFSRATKPISKEGSVMSSGTLMGERAPVIQEDEKSEDQQIPTIQSPEVPPMLLESNFNLRHINNNIPTVDRNSKVAALQRYKELEEERAKGLEYSKDLIRDRKAAENDLKELKQRQIRNELSEKEKESLLANEISLKLRIQELLNSQRQKDEENESLRRQLEEYRKGDQGDHGQDTPKQFKPANKFSLGDEETNDKGQNLQNLDSSCLNSAEDIDLSIPSGGSGLKRSRSSPNIAQLVQALDVEKKPLQPHFDRSKKPVMQKPQNSDFMIRHRNFQQVYGTGKKGLTGLKNLGNSCYMNSILQCISNLRYLTDYFCNGTYKEHINRSKFNQTRGEVAEEVAQVVRHLWMGEYRSIACRDLKMVVGKYMDQFRGSGQQDAHEFLTFLMDWLHNDLKLHKDQEIHSKISKAAMLKRNPEIDAHIGAMNAWNDFKKSNESFMLTHFFVQQVSTVQCSSCSEKSMNFEEPTSNLTLLLPSTARCSLKECLLLYTSNEQISGYKCDSCHGLHDAMKTVDLCRLPPLLIIHLKRFYSDGFYHKRQTFVDFPLEGLDMRPYTLDAGQRYTVYNLCAISNHYGTLEGGHYTAYCKNGAQWYKFDDQDVSEISPSNVKSANAYILFYTAS